MSSLNGFNGQQAGRPIAARPTAEQTHGQQPQQAWGQQAQNVHPNQWGQPAPQPGHGGYAQPASDPYAPKFEPYGSAPQAAPYRAAQAPHQQPAYAPQAPQHPQAAPTYGQPPYAEHGYGMQPQAQAPAQWATHQPDPRGYDVGSYMPQASAQQAHANYRGSELRNADPEPSLSDWTQTGHSQPGYQQHDPYAQGHGDMGFAQASGGELDPAYAEDDGQEYESDEPVRGRRPLLIAAALAGAIFVGGGLAYGYKSLLGGAGSGTPPVIKSASEPSRIKPADAGGKQFAHTDSKIMGRLGEGDTPPASGELDANGTRKVATVVVGRDGSIQAPAATSADAPAAAPATDIPAAPGGGIAVPGMTVVDAFGGHGKSVAASIGAGAPEAPQKVAQAASAASQKLVVTPPPAAQKPVVIAKATPSAPVQPTPEATGSIEPQAAAPPPVKKVKKVAAATAAPAANTAAAPVPAPSSNSVATTGSGFVAVLASIPKSGSSRMDALKKFADMQQKYGNVLGGKTPDVADANLGAKGDYHRLVVGPPASRDQAASVCSQLKSQGYADCWVTSY